MRILLNGIGRIGKSILRISHNIKDFDIIAINELNPNIKNIAYTINHDSTYGNLEDKYLVVNNYLLNKNTRLEILNFDSLDKINYESFKIDVIIDASGSKTDIELLNKLNVSKIFLTHPKQNAHINLILGANENLYNNTSHKVISTSSCNASALLPILKIIDDKYGIEVGDVATIHPLLNHQKVLDSPCVGSNNRNIDCNFEFGRSSIQNIIPSATTTIDACSYVLNNINKSLFSSNSFRVNTPTVGAINVSIYTKSSCDKDELIDLFEEYSNNQKFDIVLNNYEPLVSSDFAKERFTSIIDHRFTNVTNNKLIKLVLWYDNEYGYASRVVDIVRFTTS